MSSRQFKVWFSDCEAGVGRYLKYRFTAEAMQYAGLKEDLDIMCNDRAAIILDAEYDDDAMILCDGKGVPASVVKRDLLENELRT